MSGDTGGGHLFVGSLCIMNEPVRFHHETLIFALDITL